MYIICFGSSWFDFGYVGEREYVVVGFYAELNWIELNGVELSLSFGNLVVSCIVTELIVEKGQQLFVKDIRQPYNINMMISMLSFCESIWCYFVFLLSYLSLRTTRRYHSNPLTMTVMSERYFIINSLVHTANTLSLTFIIFNRRCEYLWLGELYIQ